MRKLLLPLILLLGACGGGDSESPVLTFADFANPPTTTEVLSDSSSTLPPSSSTTSTSSTTTTLIVVDSPSAVAITTESGFSLLEGRGAPQRLVETAIAAGYEDFDGGFVFQLPGAGTDPDADQRIFWSRTSKPNAEPFLDVTEGSLLKLWGTAEVDGAALMILTVTDDPEDPDLRVERLVAYEFGGGDRVLAEVGGDGSGPLSISYGGGRYLLEQAAGEQTIFEFRNDQGAVIELGSNPQPGCADEPSCARHPVLHPSGSFVAFVEGPEDLMELVVLDLDLDEEIRRIPLPGSTGEVTGLDYSGETVLLNRIDPAGRELALVINVSGSTVGEFGLTGRLQFVGAPIEVEGPVGILEP